MMNMCKEISWIFIEHEYIIMNIKTMEAYKAGDNGLMNTIDLNLMKTFRYALDRC